MNIKLERKLTHIFGMTKRRDALLGDLLYSLKTEGYGVQVEDLSLRLATCHNRSESMANCMEALINYLEATEGPYIAYNLSQRLAVAAYSGPVVISMLKKMVALEAFAKMEHTVKKETSQMLDGIRRRSVEDGSIRPTLMCYTHTGPTRKKKDPILEPVTPPGFVWALEHSS